jgi:hypothetical protein
MSDTALPRALGLFFGFLFVGAMMLNAMAFN